MEVRGHLSPCSFNGECLFDGSCECYYGYRGEDCAHMCPGIESMPFTGRRAWECSGRGSCGIYPYQLNDSATCICQQGYAGLDCRLACPGFLEAAGICFQKGVCLANLYQVSNNGGLSYLKPNGWPKAGVFPRPLGSCVCDSGYRGDACHLRCPGNVPPLNTSSCSGHGECLADATCDCQWGYPADVDSGWRGETLYARTYILRGIRAVTAAYLPRGPKVYPWGGSSSPSGRMRWLVAVPGTLCR